MVEENRYCVAQIVLHGHEQTVLLRPLGNLLAMSVLNLENEVAKPTAFEDQVPSSQPSPEELELAKRLIRASTAQEFDFAAYKDAYTEKLTKLIEAKVAGEEIVAPAVHEQPQIINLMDALRASLAKGLPAEKPPKRMAPSKGKEARGRKKKTS
jgi:DNA end-binding protein Ku